MLTKVVEINEKLKDGHYVVLATCGCGNEFKVRRSLVRLNKIDQCPTCSATIRGKKLGSLSKDRWDKYRSLNEENRVLRERLLKYEPDFKFEVLSS